MARPVIEATVRAVQRASSTVHPAAAFEFLKASMGKYPCDVSSATPLLKTLPSGIVAEARSVPLNFRQFKGQSRGEAVVLTECRKYLERDGFSCTEDNIALVPDITSGIETLYSRLPHRYGSSVLVVSPIFGYLVEELRRNSRSYELLPSVKPDFEIAPDSLHEAMQRTGSKVVLMAPFNPIGKLKLSRKNSEGIAQVIRDNEGICIIDYAFGSTNWSRDRSVPTLISDLGPEHAIMLTSLSKLLPITRVGFCMGPKEIMSQMAKIGGHSITDQSLLTLSLRDNEENKLFFEQSRRAFYETIGVFNEETAKLNRVFMERFGATEDGEEYVKPYNTPESGVVAMLDFSRLRKKFFRNKSLETGLDVARWMAESAGIASVPGECFYIDERDMAVRIALGCDSNDLEKTPAEKMQNMFSRMTSAVMHITNEPTPSPTLLSPHIIKLLGNGASGPAIK